MKYFTIEELCRSDAATAMGIDNRPNPTQVENLKRLIVAVLDPARDALGRPIHVNSGLRVPRLNSIVGGAPRSYHLQGRAADLTVGNSRLNRPLYQILQQLTHTELLWEGGGRWIRVAL
ncbi:MAG: peptidase M15 [Muribaculaceae bacterium]|nr:peptidase M15 [Muribaculaceae bacterium]